MTHPSPYVLSLVERGWRAAREASLRTQSQLRWIHVIKGPLPTDVRALIAPVPSIRIVCLPRAVYWIAIWGFVAMMAAGRRLQTIVVDNGKAERRLSKVRWLLALPTIVHADACSTYF